MQVCSTLSYLPGSRASLKAQLLVAEGGAILPGGELLLRFFLERFTQGFLKTEIFSYSQKVFAKTCTRSQSLIVMIQKAKKPFL